MSKPSQILHIDPPTELTFKGPFTDVVTSYLKLTNPSDKQVCFKVKTRAPKQYCIRPNSGLIPPGGNVSVAVMLQPIDLATDQERSKHKFTVQSAFVPDGETSLDNIWKSTTTTDFMDSKLRVVFDSSDNHDKPLTKAGASPAKQRVKRMEKSGDAGGDLSMSYTTLGILLCCCCCLGYCLCRAMREPHCETCKALK